ncbi:MAG: hypothetical protein U0M70_06595 [Eubacteriales bacterium]
MKDEKKKKSITINFSMFLDLDNLRSVGLNEGDHIIISGWKNKGNTIVTYELFRSNAIDAEILKEEYEQ